MIAPEEIDYELRGDLLEIVELLETAVEEGTSVVFSPRKAERAAQVLRKVIDG